MTLENWPFLNCITLLWWARVFYFHKLSCFQVLKKISLVKIKRESYMSSLGECGFLFADVPPLWGSLGSVERTLLGSQRKRCRAASRWHSHPFQELGIYCPNFNLHLSWVYSKSETLDGNLTFGHISHAEVLDLYVVLDMENYDIRA